MAERKSVNKYYPPDWDPSKGSVNKYVGQHPLRDRAKKLGQGILVIRFEMPYNIWCGGCGSHIGMGVRYNAEKSKAGMYYTTPIYKFRMKCHLCDNYFVIQTDPKNHDYVILEGARRKEQRWDPKENGQIETEDKAVQKKMATDAMFKQEHGSDDVKKGIKAKTNLSTLESRRDEWKDDYMLNKLARQKFREKKKAAKAEADNDASLLAKSSLDIPLQPENERDIKLASLIKYKAVDSYDERQVKKRKEIESQSLFQTNKHAKTITSPDEKKKSNTIVLSKVKVATTHGSGFYPGKANSPAASSSSLSRQSLGIRKKTPVVNTLEMNLVARNQDLSHSVNDTINDPVLSTQGIMGDDSQVNDNTVHDCEDVVKKSIDTDSEQLTQFSVSNEQIHENSIVSINDKVCDNARDSDNMLVREHMEVGNEITDAAYLVNEGNYSNDNEILVAYRISESPTNDTEKSAEKLKELDNTTCDGKMLPGDLKQSMTDTVTDMAHPSCDAPGRNCDVGLHIEQNNRDNAQNDSVDNQDNAQNDSVAETPPGSVTSKDTATHTRTSNMEAASKSVTMASIDRKHTDRHSLEMVEDTVVKSPHKTDTTVVTKRTNQAMSLVSAYSDSESDASSNS